MGTRWFLALLSLFFMLLAPVTSFPTRSDEYSQSNLAGVTSFLRMLKDQIVNRSKGTGSKGIQRGPKGHHQVNAKVSSLNLQGLSEWPPKNTEEWDVELDQAPKDDLSILANDSDGDLLVVDTAAAVGSTALENDKRSNDYGHGFFFGKRVPSDKVHGRQQDPTMHRERRPNDYNWGMWFGKRGATNNAYGWGGFFGKRSGDVIDYPDFVA